MEKEINIAEILKDCPQGIKLYSPAFGEVRLYMVANDKTEDICVTKDICVTDKSGNFWNFYKNGVYSEHSAEIMLFPSKDQRKWIKFKKPVVPPFEVHQCKGSETYYFIDTDLDVVLAKDFNIPISGTTRFRIGNYFNSLEQAEYAAEKVKELLLSMRKEVPNE